jgi:predicted amidohydrolase
VFPELITSGYELGVRFTELAQRVPGPAINLMAQRAADAGVYIAFGLVTKEKVESILYNSAVLVGPEGELLGAYHKVHLRGEERMAFREGFKLPIIDTGEIGKIGLMLGWDLAFPEVSRAMTLDGAELLCVMANWETSYMDEWKTYVRARAYENAIFVAAANRVGNDVTMNFGGESMIVGPRGRVYASLESESAPAREPAKVPVKEPEKEAVPAGVGVTAGGNGDGQASAPAPAAVPTAVSAALGKPPAPEIVKSAEGYCVARIDLDEVRRYREEFQTLQARQPTVYRAVVRKY